MRKDAAGYNSAFIDEWIRRMNAAYNPDDYIAVIVRVYETHFTEEELRQLTQAQRDVQQGKPPSLPDPLKAKLSADNVTIQSEILGGCSQVGAKLGGSIGEQIGKEHPEWTKSTQKS